MTSISVVLPTFAGNASSRRPLNGWFKSSYCPFRQRWVVAALVVAALLLVLGVSCCPNSSTFRYRVRHEVRDRQRRCGRRCRGGIASQLARRCRRFRDHGRLNSLTTPRCEQSHALKPLRKIAAAKRKRSSRLGPELFDLCRCSTGPHIAALSVARSAPASPSLSFAKLRSDKKQTWRPGSNFRADSLQS